MLLHTAANLSEQSDDKIATASDWVAEQAALLGHEAGKSCL